MFAKNKWPLVASIFKFESYILTLLTSSQLGLNFRDKACSDQEAVLGAHITIMEFWNFPVTVTSNLNLSSYMFDFDSSKSHFPNPYPFPFGFKSYKVWVRKCLQKLLLGPNTSPSLRTRKWLYSVSVTTRTRTRRTIRTPPKYIIKECISGRKFCITTFLQIWRSSFDGVGHCTPKSWLLQGRCSVHPNLYKDKFKFEVIVTGKFHKRGHSLIVMWALKTASWLEQVLSLQLSPNC